MLYLAIQPVARRFGPARSGGTVPMLYLAIQSRSQSLILTLWLPALALDLDPPLPSTVVPGSGDLDGAPPLYLANPVPVSSLLSSPLFSSLLSFSVKHVSSCSWQSFLPHPHLAVDSNRCRLLLWLASSYSAPGSRA